MGMPMESTTYLPITVIPTKTFQENEHVIYMNSSLMKYLGMQRLEQLHLCIGNRKIKVAVDLKDVEKDHLLLSEELMTAIPIPVLKHRLLSQYDRHHKSLFLGPILAVVTEVTESESGMPNFRSIHSFAEELHYTTHIAGGIFYVFHLKDFSTDEIKGWYFDGENWKKGSFVPPNTIYNRIHSRKIEASSFFKKFQTELLIHNIPMFNQNFLSKWEVHQILFDEDFLHPYLPDTSIFRVDTLHLFLTKYHSIFIKPINGSQGRNIFHLSTNDKKIVVRLSAKMENMEFSTIDEFIEWFQSRSNPSTYIIQNAIPLAKYEDRQLDFRVLCHKNYQEQWKITSVVARISAKNQFVSNLARGGELLNPTKPLSLLFGHKTVMGQLPFMKELSLEVANIISQSSHGFIGELGIDMGIDDNGKPWIIEVNSKPSKNAEEQRSNIRPSAKAIFEYATHLSFQHLRQL